MIEHLSAFVNSAPKKSRGSSRPSLPGHKKAGRQWAAPLRVAITSADAWAAGTPDLDSELEIWFSGPGKVKFDFFSNANVPEICRNSVAMILRNPTYIGKVVWNQKSHIKKGSHGNAKHVTIYNPREQWTITDGLHPAIVEKELYDQVQDIMAGRYRPSKQDGTVKSSLAELVRCANCGKNMQKLNMNGGP